MKKSFVLILAVLILPVISAVQIDMKSNFSQGETLIAQISGNFLEKMQSDNVLLYKEHVRVSFIPFVSKMQDKYYVYGQLSGKSGGNYSLVIRDVSYFESGETKDNDIAKNFTITGDNADFSITPGFLEATGDFSVTAQNLVGASITIASYIRNETGEQTESLGFLSSLFGGSSSAGISKTETQISPGQTKSISFPVNKSYSNQIIYAVLETENTIYEVPVLISTVAEENRTALEFRPDEREVSIATNSGTFIYLYLYNAGQTNLADVSLSVSDLIKPYVSLSNETFSLDSNSSIKIIANISSGTTEGFTEGLITATWSNITADFNLKLNFSKDYVPPAGTSFQTCAEKSGQFCTADQKCTGKTENAADGACCIGECMETANANAGKILGWGLVALILALLIAFIIFRFVKAKRPLNLPLGKK